MSLVAVTWALDQWKRANITATERVVLMALADHHNKTTQLCCPSQKLLADECGLTDRSVRNQLASLEEKKLISRRQVFQNSVQIGVEYTLSWGAETVSTRAEWGAETVSTRTVEPSSEIDKSISSPRTNERGCRLPEDWQPEPLTADFLKKWPVTDEFCENQFYQFLDYWGGKPGAAGRKTDWQGTWRNWLRRGLERQRGSPQRKTAHQNTRDHLKEILADDEHAARETENHSNPAGLLADNR